MWMYIEPEEDTMIASLQSEWELMTALCNTVRELPVTLKQIKREAFHDEYINQIKAKNFEKDPGTTDVFSICNEVLLYRERVVNPSTIHKISTLATQRVLE